MFCRYCGNKVGKNAVFCRSCGAQLRQPAVTKGAVEISRPVEKRRSSGAGVLTGVLLVILCIFLAAAGVFLIPRGISSARMGKRRPSEADAARVEKLLSEEEEEEFILEIPETDEEDSAEVIEN